jgi:hypothetical protein
MRIILLFSAVLLVSGCASQGRRCTTCGDPPLRTPLFRRIGRPQLETSSDPVAVPAPHIIPGTVKPVPAAESQGTRAKVGATRCEGMLRYASLAEGAQR